MLQHEKCVHTISCIILVLTYFPRDRRFRRSSMDYFIIFAVFMLSFESTMSGNDFCDRNKRNLYRLLGCFEKPDVKTSCRMLTMCGELMFKEYYDETLSPSKKPNHSWQCTVYSVDWVCSFLKLFNIHAIHMFYILDKNKRWCVNQVRNQIRKKALSGWMAGWLAGCHYLSPFESSIDKKIKWWYWVKHSQYFLNMFYESITKPWRYIFTDLKLTT